jgi:hypothetical protein
VRIPLWKTKDVKKLQLQKRLQNGLDATEIRRTWPDSKRYRFQGVGIGHRIEIISSYARGYETRRAHY